MNADEQDSIDSLRERLRRLEAAVDAAGLGVWEWDVRKGALTWNDRNRELLGITHDRPVVIDDYLGQVHPDDLEAVQAEACAALACSGTTLDPCVTCRLKELSFARDIAVSFPAATLISRLQSLAE